MEGLELIWEGRDPVFFSRLVSALDGAEIPCHAKAIPEALVSQLANLPRYEVRVFSSDRVTAERIVQDLQVAGSREFDANREEESDEARAPQVVPDLVSQSSNMQALSSLDQRGYEWKPERAELEAWSGDDSAVAEFLRDAFREQGIGYRTLFQIPSRQQILVGSEDLPRAREIVRQVTNGVPPE
ncbi:MAG: hypothetical protein L0387_46380 [Acidobacteria bacterium]|nr:hypothetical protein [Acidobacteriota bacterium]